MNNSYIKYVYIILLIIFLCFSFTIHSGKDLNEIAYVIAIGLDVGEANKLKLSLQISNPSASEKSEPGSNSSQSSDSIIESIECSSLNSGFNLFNSFLSKELNLSHCKVLVISENLANTDISEYLYTLMNNIEFRSDANIVVCKNSTEMFLKSSKPSLEQLSARYYESIPTSSEYTGYTANITFGDFFSAYTDSFTDPVAILAAINSKSSQNVLTDVNSNSNLNVSGESTEKNFSIFSSPAKDSYYLAGQMPLNSQDTTENIGLAVFNNGKIVGELNGLETMIYLLMDNKLKSAQISIPNPYYPAETMDIKIKPNSNTKCSVDLVNGTPYIKINIDILTRLMTMDTGTDTLNEERVKKVEEYTNKYLKEHILSYLYRVSKDFKTDINGFGRFACKNFLVWDDWLNYNWLHKFESATFNVNVNSNFKSSYLLMES